MKPIVIQIILVVALIVGTINTSHAQSAEQLYQKGLVKEQGEGALQEAIVFFNQVADNSNADIPLRAKALLHVGMCFEKLGTEEATKAYQRLVNSFPSQKNEVAIARERLSLLILRTENIPEIPLKPNFTKIKMPGNPGNGMLSPDGKKIAFISEGDVWVVPVSGGVNPYIAGEPKRLTNNIGAGDMSNSFCWSGNGKWIAFNAEPEKTTSSTSIYVIPSEGGDAQKVQVPSHICGWPSEFRLSLSPDGKTLAYASGWLDYNTRTTQIYTIPVNGNEAKELTEPGTWDQAWSPDGSRIAFVKFSRDNERNEYSELLVIPAQGGTPKKLIDKQLGQISGPVWSPDGKMIAFIRRPEGENPKEIWIVPVTNEGNPSGTSRKVDLPLESFHTIAGWTPDNKIGVQLTNPEYEIIYTVPAAGGIATQVTPHGWISYPKWSPDGKRIYFRWDGGKIASVPSEGGAVDSIQIDSEFVTGTAVPGSGNEISPDGKTIVFAGMKNFYEGDKKNWEVDIFTVPVEGGNPKQLTSISNDLQDRFPCWSPDGNSIAFIRPEKIDNKFFHHIYTMSSDGKNLKRITEKSDEVAWAPIDWTPDGKSISFFAKNNSIRSIPVEGGESKFVTKINSVNSQFDLAWSPDSKELAYTDKGKIWIFTPGSDTTKEVKTGVDAHATKIGWSPDGTKIAFTAFAGGDAELWMMENFLPLEKLPQKKETENFVIRKVLDGTGVEFEGGNPSPDGNNFAFTDWATGNLTIYESATGKQRPITTQASWETDHVQYVENSTWSPDGLQIVYDWQNENGFIELRIIRLDDLKPRILYKNEEVVYATTYDWSGDGKQILACFQRKDETRQIVLVNAEDGSVHVLKTMVEKKWPAWPWNMSFSPDGRYLVYDFPPEEYSQDRDLFLMSTKGGPDISLVKHPACDYLLGWAPDGKNILFCSDRTGTFDAYVVQVAEGKPQGAPKLIKSDIGKISPKGFTQKGSFYYSNSREGYDVYTAELDPEKGNILVPPEKLIKRFEGSNAYPYYSPDGKSLAYISIRSGKGIICIRSLETGKEREVFLDLFNIWRARCFRWSPDGSSILAQGRDNKNRSGIFQISVQTGNITPIIPWEYWKSTFIHSVEWSGDGKAVFYVDFNTNKNWSNNNPSQIMVRDLDTGVEKELYRFDNYINISLSPDGKWLASSHPLSLKVMPATGGEPRELYRFEEEYKNERPITWSADGKYILFSKIDPEQNGWDLCRIPAEGGAPQKLGLKMENSFMNLSAYPNGRNIAFSSTEETNAEFWIMDNFLPKEE